MGIERHVVTALSLLSEAFERALGAELDGFGIVDSEVVVSQLDDAGRHVTAALFALRPEIRKLAPQRRCDKLDQLFARFPIDVDCDLDALVIDAWDELSEALHSRDEEVRRECDFAMSHLDVVLLIFDPRMYSRTLETASSDDRVKVASMAEQAELMLEAARELVKWGSVRN